MAVTALWAALALSVVLLELFARRRPGRLASLGAIAAGVWRHPLGRLVLLALWALVGWHFFSRDRLG